MWLTDGQKIGVALTTFGAIFMLLGVMLFFDGALLALGNILFISGLTLIIGPQKTFYFFARKQKIRGSICFFGGVLLVFLKWPIIGVLVETFGFLNLFGDFFPVVVTFLRQMPFIGTLLTLPYIRDMIFELRISSVAFMDALKELLNQRYSLLKAQFPRHGRRKWMLHVLSEFWAVNQQGPPLAYQGRFLLADQLPIRDDDPYDLVVGEHGGILLRTDFSDDQAWKTFLSMFGRAEQEFVSAQASDGEGSNASDSSSSSGEEASLINVVNPTTLDDQIVLRDISNLTALRLVNDVGIRATPSPSMGTKRISTPNPLIDCFGWQEIYSGPTVWVYDIQSNIDQSVRLISGEGDVYGTATGDSWRALVSHIYELQFNMTYMSMKINFGGMDRWDHRERQRNLTEAAL